MADHGTFVAGATFPSFAEFTEKRLQFQAESGFTFSVKNSSTLKGNEKLQFSSVLYYCRKGGTFKSKSAGLRQTSSEKVQCPAIMKIIADKRRKCLVITELIVTHNHEPTKITNTEGSEAKTRKAAVVKPLKNNFVTWPSRTFPVCERSTVLLPIVDKLVEALLESPSEDVFTQGVKEVSSIINKLQPSTESNSLTFDDINDDDLISAADEIIGLDPEKIGEGLVKEGVIVLTVDSLGSPEKSKEGLTESLNSTVVDHRTDYSEIADEMLIGVTEVIKNQVRQIKDPVSDTTKVLISSPSDFSGVNYRIQKRHSTVETVSSEEQKVSDANLISGVLTIDDLSQRKDDILTTTYLLGKSDRVDRESVVAMAKKEEKSFRKDPSTSEIGHMEINNGDEPSAVGNIECNESEEVHNSSDTASEVTVKSVSMSKKVSGKGRPKGKRLKTVGLPQKPKALSTRHNEGTATETEKKMSTKDSTANAMDYMEIENGDKPAAGENIISNGSEDIYSSIVKPEKIRGKGRPKGKGLKTVGLSQKPKALSTRHNEGTATETEKKMSTKDSTANAMDYMEIENGDKPAAGGNIISNGSEDIYSSIVKPEKIGEKDRPKGKGVKTVGVPQKPKAHSTRHNEDTAAETEKKVSRKDSTANAIDYMEIENGDKPAAGENIVSNRSEDIYSSIVMPEKIRGKGRPKGKGLTVIGLPRKSKNILTFSDKDIRAQIRDILSWLLESELVEIVMKGESLIRQENFNVDDLRDSLVDETVDINIVKEYFEPHAFASLMEALDAKKERDDLACATCKKPAKEACVICDRCLLWQHYECVGLVREPKAKKWFCPHCSRQ